MATCSARRRDGSPCHAVALAGNKRCAFHCDRADVKRALIRGRRQGGVSRTARKPIVLEAANVEIHTSADVTTLLETVIQKLLSSELDPRRANALILAATAISNALRIGDGRPVAVEFHVHPPSGEVPDDLNEQEYLAGKQKSES